MVEARLREETFADPDRREVRERVVLRERVLVGPGQLLGAVEHADDRVFGGAVVHFVQRGGLVHVDGLVRPLEELVHRNAGGAFEHHQPLGRRGSRNVAQAHGRDVVERLVHLVRAGVVDVEALLDVLGLDREV